MFTSFSEIKVCIRAASLLEPHGYRYRACAASFNASRIYSSNKLKTQIADRKGF